MAIFGKRKGRKEGKGGKGKKKEFVAPVDVEMIDTSKLISQQIHTTQQLSEDFHRQPSSINDSSENLAPVFVKISKYKDIMNTVNYLKMSFTVLKNQVAILSKLQNLQRQNMKLMYTVLDKTNNQLDKLGTDFSKPVNFMKEVSESKVQEVNHLESTINDLKTQIDKLNVEVESMA